MEGDAAGTNSDDEFVPVALVEAVEKFEDAAGPAAVTTPPPADPHSVPINSGWTHNVMPTSDLPIFEANGSRLKVALTPDQLRDPLHMFKLFVDDDMLIKICKQTNLYAAQVAVDIDSENARAWHPVEPNELSAWLGMAVSNSLHPYPSMKSYFRDDFAFSLPQMKDVMSLTRFEQIKRFLHLADRSQEKPPRTEGYDPLFKVRPLLSALQEKSTALYHPGQMVSIDEMDIAFKGRSQHKSRIKFKRAGNGFLTYSLCDPANGYTYSMVFQFDPQIPVMKEGMAKTFNAVLYLASKLPSKGHHVFADNLYSNAALAQELFRRGHMYTCTA